MMRVTIEFHEPVDRWKGEVPCIQGSVESVSMKEAIVSADPGSEVAGFAIEWVSLRPRYQGDSLESIEGGVRVTINGSAHSSDSSEPFHFIGSVRALID